MTSEELKSKITHIIDEKKFGIKMYATIADGENFKLKKFQANDALLDKVSEKLHEILSDEILSDEIISDDFILSQDINEKANAYLEVVQDDSYHPFKFLNDNLDSLEKYKEKIDQSKLKGFCIRINKNDNFFWVYQHKYPVSLIHRDGSLLAILNDEVYEPLDRDIIKLESRIDIIIVGNSIISKNINLLQSVFGYNEYIHKAAERVIESIKSMDIISDLSKLIELSNDKKLTTAKKLMKAKNSAVFRIDPNELLKKLKAMDYYRENIKIDKIKKKILITSKKDVNEFLKMLNDEILKSELTDNNYESSVKEVLKK